MTTSTVTVDDLLANAAWARRLARNLVHDADSADDLVQDTWITALRAQPDRSQPLRPWLSRVLRNQATDQRRSESRRLARHEQAGESVAGAAIEDPEVLLSRVQVQRLLADLICALPEPARQTVLLRYYEGLTSEQIGGVMGVAAGTVRRRLKEAVDQLRDELDRRHQGDREAWLRALLPLAPIVPAESAPAPSTTAAPPSVAARIVLAGCALVAAGAGLKVCSVMRARPPSAAVTPGSPGGPRGDRSLAAAAPPVTLDQCRTLLAARRRRVAEAEARHVTIASPSTLFDEGAPNPTAREALLPEIERLARGDAGPNISFAVECRTWACRVTVLQPGAYSGRAARTWLASIPNDPDVRARLRSWAGGRNSPVEDPVSRAPYNEGAVFLGLKAPSGARIAGTPPPVDPAGEPPPPITLAACRNALAAADRRLSDLGESEERELTPAQRFAESPPNPTLTVRFSGLVNASLRRAGAGVIPEVQCRGPVCRVSLPGQAAETWRNPVERDPEVTRLVIRRSSDDQQVFYQVAADQRAPGWPRMTEPMLAQSVFRAANMAACSARFPVTGDLEITLLFPGSAHPDPSVRPGRINTRYAGSLAGSPLGRCVEEQIDRELQHTPLPGAFRGLVRSRFQFPMGRE